MPDDLTMTTSLRTSGPVTLSEEQITQIMQKLGDMRHDVTGRLSNIAAAGELIRARPEKAEERLKILLDQPHLAAETIAKFSRELEAILGVARR
jgi:hypothetical protein